MRVDYRSVFPNAIKAMAGLEEAVHESSLDAELLELVKLRASRTNGSISSAGCVRMGCDPADRQQKGALVDRLKAVRHALSHSHQHARRDAHGLIADGEVHIAQEPMQRDWSVSVMLVHSATGLESDQHNSNTRLFGNCMGSVIRCRVGLAAPQRR